MRHDQAPKNDAERCVRGEQGLSERPVEQPPDLRDQELLQYECCGEPVQRDGHSVIARAIISSHDAIGPDERASQRLYSCRLGTGIRRSYTTDMCGRITQKSPLDLPGLNVVSLVDLSDTATRHSGPRTFRHSAEPEDR